MTQLEARTSEINTVNQEVTQSINQVSVKPNVTSIGVFALDIGNRMNKCGCDEKLFMFPSYQTRRLAKQDFDWMPEDSWLISQGSCEWVTGKVAENLATPTYTGNKWEHAAVFLYSAIAKSGLTGDIHIEKLRVSTPDKQSSEQTNKLKALKDGHSFSWNGNDVSLVISEVQILDEGVTSWLNANRQNLWLYPHYLNAVLDVGGGTTIGRLICPNTGVIREAEFLIEGGTSKLASQIESDLGLKNVTPIILDGIEKNDFVLPSGQNFNNAFEYAKNRWITELKGQIKTHWSSYQDRMAQILIVGGSAPLLQDWTTTDASRYFIPENPQTFGVEGLLYG